MAHGGPWRCDAYTEQKATEQNDKRKDNPWHMGQQHAVAARLGMVDRHALRRGLMLGHRVMVKHDVMLWHHRHLVMHARHGAHGIFLQRDGDQRRNHDQQDRKQRGQCRCAFPC